MSLPRLLLPLLAVLPGVALSVQQYGYRVTDQKPTSTDNYVQGLEIVDNYLYVSTGMYGQSRMMRYHFADLSLETSRRLDQRIFAEGLTVLHDKVFQLTWRNRLMLVYSKDSLQLEGGIKIPGEGWGLTNNGEQLVYTDGSDKLHFMSPESGQITRSVSVREAGQAVYKLNELEWIDGRIWANVWHTDRIVIIDPDNGEVQASIDLQGLLPVAERGGSEDVLNGIARNPADGTIWVTGKRWPWLYQIELVPGPANKQRPDSRKSR